jgi:hypothetical protein
VARHIFQACAVWIYTRVTSQASYSPEYITPTRKKSFLVCWKRNTPWFTQFEFEFFPRYSILWVLKESIYITRNTCMQQPLAYILQTLFQRTWSIRNYANTGWTQARVAHVMLVMATRSLFFKFFVQTCKQ